MEDKEPNGVIATAKGRIEQIFDKKSGTSKAGKDWIKQEFAIATSGEYSKTIVFNLFGDDKVKLLQRFHVGSLVMVSFNVSSREFNGKFYTNIDAWKISAIDGMTGDAEDAPDDVDQSEPPF